LIQKYFSHAMNNDLSLSLILYLTHLYIMITVTYWRYTYNLYFSTFPLIFVFVLRVIIYLRYLTMLLFKIVILITYPYCHSLPVEYEKRENIRKKTLVGLTQRLITCGPRPPWRSAILVSGVRGSLKTSWPDVIIINV